MNTIRDNIPVEGLLRAYIDETEETEITEKEEITKEIIEVATPQPASVEVATPQPVSVEPPKIVSSENIVLDINTEKNDNTPLKSTTTEKTPESQIVIKDPEEIKPEVPSLNSLAEISNDLEKNTNISFNTIGEALDINGEKEKFNPLDQPERVTDYDADDDDEDKLTIGDSISLNDTMGDLSLDVSDKKINTPKR